ncbi:hypothetical protein ACTXIX_16760 [Glutamicibacter ardleyensis]|uniref:hypothetical protein n=1 Tax=Glutamicibacter ardleyensis TaxID=225894 RepID=UPI003FD6568D
MTTQRHAEVAQGLPIQGHMKVHPELSDSVFSDGVWTLDVSRQKSTAPLINFHFANVPSRARDFCKHFLWLLLNEETPINQMNRKHSIRSRLSVQSVRTTYHDILPFLRWFEFSKEQNLSDLTPEALDQYADLIADSKVSYNPKRRQLLAVSRVWLLSPFLPAHYRIVPPPWERLGNLEDIVGASDWTAENKTEPIHPATMSPLLIWCQRLVNDLSSDVIEASSVRDKMKAAIPKEQPSNGLEIINSYIRELQLTGQKLPATIVRNRRQGRSTAVAAEYLSATLGVPQFALKGIHHKYEVSNEASAPLPYAPTGTIDGKPWTDSIDYYEATRLKRLVLTACLVIVCYLSGMRGEEVRALKRGCCTEITDDDGSTSFRIEGQTFKSATDEQGNLIPGGKTREVPWTVIGPVADAIRVAERLHDHELLFPQKEFHIISSRSASTFTSVSNQSAKWSIQWLIDWCNEQAERLEREHEIIPEDPAGLVVLRRFRRTLAWFIYRLPGGRVALGIQYGHLHSYTTDGYGSRVSAGLRDLFPMEEALSVSDGLARAVDAADNGSHVSGPAAERYKRAVEEYRDVYSGKVMNAKQAASLMRNPALRIYDNGPQILACCYDPAKALCHPDRKVNKAVGQSPDPTACDSRCANIARTDEHIERIQQLIDEFKREAESEAVPLPLRERSKQRVSLLEALVQAHDETGVEL